MGMIYKRGKVFWIKYYCTGRPIHSRGRRGSGGAPIGPGAGDGPHGEIPGCFMETPFTIMPYALSRSFVASFGLVEIILQRILCGS
jgi:hypothetical protein